MACHQFPMVGYIHLMDTGNLPSCESCSKMLLTSKSGNQEEQHVHLALLPRISAGLNVAFHVCELSIGQDCRKWSPGRCLGSISQLGAVDQQVERQSSVQWLGCCRCSVPNGASAEKPMQNYHNLVRMG